MLNGVPMTNPTIVLAQLKIDNCTAELYLNGVPLMRLLPDRMTIQNIPAEEFLLPGKNTLEILVEPGNRPSLARSESRSIPFQPMHAIGRLIRFPDGVPGTVEHGELIAETIFDWPAATPDQQVFPQSMITHVDLGAAHGAFSWQSAPPLSLDDYTLNEALTLLNEIELAIRTYDTHRLWQLSAMKNEDVVRSYMAVDEGFLRSELESLMAHQRKATDPVKRRDPRQHDFRLVAGGRLLECIDQDWTPSFKLLDPDGDPLPYQLFLARINGQLQIVR